MIRCESNSPAKFTCNGMVRFPSPNQIHPPNHLSKFPTPNSTPSLHRCLSLLNSCSSPNQLFQIHAHITTSGLHHNPEITSKIKEPFSWNNIIRTYATSSNSVSQTRALYVFLDMRRLDVKPNEHTFPFIFKACASFSGLNVGRQIHVDAVKHGYGSNVYVQNTLIQLYGSCKKIVDAYKVFDEMPKRTVVSWNSVISACVECSWFDDAVELFVKMRGCGFEPDETTMVVMLTVCSEVGNLGFGKWVHSRVIGKGMVVNCQLGTALVDMYGKCGDVVYGKLVFDRMVNRNVWTWSAMILGFAQHGFARKALELFKEMKNYSIKPNHVTFLGVLCACSHAGLVGDGKRYFDEMEKRHGIKPVMVHFGAMVDILGRSGRLKEAYDFVTKMPFEADSIVWRALLSACNIHDVNDCLGVGEKARKRLIELEPKRCGNLVMLANNYAEVGMWEKAAHLRSKMRVRGLKKVAGESCVEVSGSTFRFLSGDCSCVQSDHDILSLLNILNLHAKMIQYE